jgi:thiol-disulfide isomerase/thioredoxin
MKTKWTLSMVGVVVPALAAAGVFRELSAPGDTGPAGPADRKPRMSEAENPKPVADLKFVDRTGAARSLAEFGGRFVLLNAWATWCAPCRKEMPSLDRLQQTLGGADFEVVALSIDRGGVFAVESFYEELDLRALRVYVDSSAEVLPKLGAPGIPVSVFVDRSGRELWRVVGPARWDDPRVVARLRASFGPARDS